MVASPTGLTPLDVERERTRIQEATAGLQARGLVELEWLDPATPRELQAALRRDKWHIFHFAGHGGFDPAIDEGVVALVDEDGSAVRVPATQLGRLLGDHNPLRLAVLNACEGARGSTHDLFSSTAATLVRRGTPAVVAMQYEITDDAAKEFGRAFYEAIADDLPVDIAVAEARKSLSIQMSSTLEWGTPVLFMRTDDGVLFRIRRPKATAAGRPVPAADQVTTGSVPAAALAASPAAGASVASVGAGASVAASPIAPTPGAARPVVRTPSGADDPTASPRVSGDTEVGAVAAATAAAAAVAATNAAATPIASTSLPADTSPRGAASAATAATPGPVSAAASPAVPTSVTKPTLRVGTSVDRYGGGRFDRRPACSRSARERSPVPRWRRRRAVWIARLGSFNAIAGGGTTKGTIDIALELMPSKSPISVGIANGVKLALAEAGGVAGGWKVEVPPPRSSTTGATPSMARPTCRRSSVSQASWPSSGRNSRGSPAARSRSRTRPAFSNVRRRRRAIA